MAVTIESYAAQHRLRLRNLHDGKPVPPCPIKKARKVLSEAYRRPEDSCLAIVGNRGYVFAQDGRLEWYLSVGMAGEHRRSLESQIQEAGGTVRQRGDLESAGTSPESAIAAICRAIKARKVGTGGPGRTKEELAALSQRRIRP